MKKRFFKAVAAVTAMTLVSGIFTGCGNSGSEKTAHQATESLYSLTGAEQTQTRVSPRL